MNEDAREVPEHWSDLTDDVKAELLALARSRITSRTVWNGIWRRLERMRGVGTFVLMIAMLWTIFGDAVAEVLKPWVDGKK